MPDVSYWSCALPPMCLRLSTMQYFSSRVSRQPFSHDRAGEPGADDQIIKHVSSFSNRAGRVQRLGRRLIDIVMP